MLERITLFGMWSIAGLVVVYLLTPLLVTVAVSFSASPVFDLPPPRVVFTLVSAVGATAGLG